MSHIRDHKTRKRMLKQNVQCVFKRRNPNLHLGANHNPLRADRRRPGSYKHTEAWEGDCVHGREQRGAGGGGLMLDHKHLEPILVWLQI